MHPALPVLVDRAQEYTPKHPISAPRDTLHRRAATLPGTAVRSRCDDPHQVSLPWQLLRFEHVFVDALQVPDTAWLLRVPPNLTSFAPFTWSDASRKPFDESTTALWQL
jgi:hypothetical protein